MRLINIVAAGLLAVGPIFAFSSPARAEPNDLLGRAQQFLNNNNNNNSQSNQDAYERGRQDEMRREQAQRDRRYRRDDDQRWTDRDQSQVGGHSGRDRETYNYNRY
ncbi:MAG TPA: hypothetical protein VJ722_12250, partial [Rhodanobacteraceae bacterium]|nr:hypothetical protein [Rhodanobacteraceae bacterium]